MKRSNEASGRLPPGRAATPALDSASTCTFCARRRSAEGGLKLEVRSEGLRWQFHILAAKDQTSYGWKCPVCFKFSERKCSSFALHWPCALELLDIISELRKWTSRNLSASAWVLSGNDSSCCCVPASIYQHLLVLDMVSVALQKPTSQGRFACISMNTHSQSGQ